MKYDTWKFADFIEEIIYICEIIEVPGMKAKREVMLTETWKRFPKESEELGLTRPQAECV